MSLSNKRDISTEIVVLAAIFGAIGIILGAFGAHALKDNLDQRGMVSVWDTAVKYQLFHAVALLALAGWLEARLARVPTGSGLECSIRGVAWWFVAGILLFSGSLYGLALGAPTWTGIITPFGGVALIVGWIRLAVVARRS